MGSYTKNLFRKSKRVKPPSYTGEHLISCAIRRGEGLHTGSFTSHAEIRRMLGDASPYFHTRGDIEGFYTSAGRFVHRDEARLIGEEAGQCSPGGELLSSDVRRWSL